MKDKIRELFEAEAVKRIKGIDLSPTSKNYCTYHSERTEMHYRMWRIAYQANQAELARLRGALKPLMGITNDYICIMSDRADNGDQQAQTNYEYALAELSKAGA